eukprot:TRINITY_DN17634_c0_g1_i5.p1 TRINITY_DN17634_c0_g1~~TRINITY_DN17634_c0_g1_i5.p1  ORF type:complete len:376 (-),score=56.23 TRINITY_DN17634_c0_g1_i5:348-1475(-)
MRSSMAAMTPFRSCTVYCGSTFGHNPKYRSAAEELGMALAAQGIELVYGGGNVGLMGAVADAALAAGGRVVGVIPHFMAKLERAHLGLSQLLCVEDMQTRKREMLLRADAFIGLPGGIGTLEEILEALEWVCSGRHAKPVGVLNVDGMYTPLQDMMRRSVRDGYMPEDMLRNFILADTMDDLLCQLQSTLEARSVVPSASSIPEGFSSAPVSSTANDAPHDAWAILLDRGPAMPESHRRVVEELAIYLSRVASKVVVAGPAAKGGQFDALVTAIDMTKVQATCVLEGGSAAMRGGSNARDLREEVVVASAGRVAQLRKRRVFEHGSTFVALPGGVAVWEEMMELLSGSQLGLHTHALGLLNCDGFFDPLHSCEER